jgi:hypothetical protein
MALYLFHGVLQEGRGVTKVPKHFDVHVPCKSFCYVKTIPFTPPANEGWSLLMCFFMMIKYEEISLAMTSPQT